MQVQDMFNQISLTYDRTNRLLSLGRDFAWRKALAAKLPPRPHLRLLDLATGTGDQLLALFQKGVSIHQAIGLDIAEEMLKLGRLKLQKYPVQMLFGDAQKIPYANNQFDAITISFGIRNVENPKIALEEMHRVLNVRGRCLILEFSMPPWWIRPFFLLYLRQIVPRLGGLVSKKKSAYQYLNQTIESFPCNERFIAWMQEAGFTNCKQYKMHMGAVSLYIGEK